METDTDGKGELSVLVLLVALVIWAGHELKARRVSVVNNGSLALTTGLLAGGGFFAWFELGQGKRIPTGLVAFKYDLYMILLSPIIYYSGFSIKKKAFFTNFTTLVLLGVVGTMLNAALLSVGAWAVLSWVGLSGHEAVGRSLALGVVFSSTDSVAALGALNQESHPQLHSLVFGEAVVNDATSIVLLRAVQHIRSESQLTGGALAAVLATFLRLSTLSLLLGAGTGLACAFVLQRSFTARHSTDRELSLLAALGFLSFIAAELLGLSGIFASFFCGLTMSHYAWHTLSPSAKVASIYSFRVLAFLAELVLFLSCGLDMWSSSLWHKELYTRGSMVAKAAGVAAALTLLVPVARALALVPLLALANRWRRPGSKITAVQGAALWWAGCARGAVTLALAVYHFVGSTGKAGKAVSIENQIICEGCMAAVVVSTVLLGGLTPAVLKRLAGDEEAGHSGSGGGGLLGSFAGPLPTVPEHGSNGGRAGAPAAEANGSSRAGSSARWNVRTAWSKLDRAYMQPLFGGRSASVAAYRSPPPSPGRWRGAASAITILQRESPSGAAALPVQAEQQELKRPPPPPPRPVKQLRTMEDEMRELLLPQGLSVDSNEESRTALEELFSQPGGSQGFDEELVDQEVQLGGLVEQAEAGTSVARSSVLGGR